MELLSSKALLCILLVAVTFTKVLQNSYFYAVLTKNVLKLPWLSCLNSFEQAMPNLLPFFSPCSAEVMTKIVLRMNIKIHSNVV